MTTEWDATTYAGRDNLLRTVRNEAEGFFALIEVPEHWESPTASGWWQVRDIVGHMVDTTEGYLERFEAAREGRDPDVLAGLTDMATTAGERAQALRELGRDVMTKRLRDAYERMMEVFESLDEQDWAGLTVLHGYMGPLPAFFYPVFQLMDYGVHSWDVRQGIGVPHYLHADAADALVPFMFILWQATTDVERIGDTPITVGIRVSGRNGGTWKVTAGKEGFVYEPGEVDRMATVIEFDPASLVLTAFGRTNAGTAYGDIEMANRFSGIFFPI